jgi:hypothetical protein
VEWQRPQSSFTKHVNRVIPLNDSPGQASLYCHRARGRAAPRRTNHLRHRSFAVGRARPTGGEKRRSPSVAPCLHSAWAERQLHCPLYFQDWSSDSHLRSAVFRGQLNNRLLTRLLDVRVTFAELLDLYKMGYGGEDEVRHGDAPCREGRVISGVRHQLASGYENPTHFSAAHPRTHQKRFWD